MTTATISQLETFRDVLYEPGDVVEVRLIKDGCRPKQRWFTAAELPRVADALMELNRDGWNVYVGINPRTKVGGSKNDQVALVRCLFADFDHACLAEVHRRIQETDIPMPGLTIHSGHGCHAYWRLTEPLVDLALFSLHQQALIAALDSDPCIHDLARVMRIPGYQNWKKVKSPRLEGGMMKSPVPCEIATVDIDAVFTLGDFPDPAPEPVSAPTPNGQVNQADRWQAVEFLDQLDPKRADDYRCWLSIGMICHSLDPGETMLQAWDEWSKISGKWAAGCCAQKWASFSPGRTSLGRGPLTIASLHKWAIEDRKQVGVSPTRSKVVWNESKPVKPTSDPQEAGSKPPTGAKSDSCQPLRRELERIEYPAPIPFSQMGESEPVDWVWDGYLAAGYISLLTGIWKGGKTTLLAHVIQACGSGGYVGSRVEPCRVLLVSEEPQGMWSRRRDDLGIGDHAHCITRPFMAKPNHPQWQAFIRHIVELTTEHIYGLIIFDTLGSVAPYQNENDAAEMQATLMPLQAIADTGAAVLLVHHPRKGGGEEGQASRGSGALTGFVDVIVELRRYSRTDRADCRRTLTTYSRFSESPPEAVIELTDDGFISLGSCGDVNKSDQSELILDILPSELPGMTVKEIKAAWDEQDATPPSASTLRRTLEYGFSKARWLRAGTGKRNDPFTYRCGKGIQP